LFIPVVVVGDTGSFEPARPLSRFPERSRPFHEVIVIGRKRITVEAAVSCSVGWESVQAPAYFIYHLPKGSSPRVFEKVEPTEPELQRMLAHSPWPSI
jgi:hypothetical protein